MSVFVTVGSTGFDDLINETTSAPFLDALKTIGITNILYQYGSSESVFIKNVQAHATETTVKINGYKYKPSITEDMEASDIIISHAGAGTILQALRLPNKKLITVINNTLMDNHQRQLAKAMQSENYAICSEISNLPEKLLVLHTYKFEPFPAAKKELFASVVDEQMGYV